jgi:hypothetical protein
MGAFVFLGGLIAIGLAIIDHFHRLVLPIGFVYSPLFWFGYVGVLTAATIIKFVRQQEVLVIERLGRYNRTLTAGINIVWPAVERVAYVFDMREQVMDVPAQDAITKDNATVTIDGILYYKIVHAKDAAYGAQDIRRAIINLPRRPCAPPLTRWSSTRLLSSAPKSTTRSSRLSPKPPSLGALK